jgi:hypothetical protein
LRSAAAALALVATLAPGLAGQAPRVTEVDLGPIATWARRDFYGGALGVARRPGGQGRLALVAAAGSSAGRAALRLEGTAQFLVTPAARTGVTPYMGLGVAYVGARGVRGSAVLLAIVGVEQAAGLRHGWFVELGLGGGGRARLGYRWRSLPPWWP